MKLILNLVILLSASIVSAASGGHGEDHGIPWKTMIIPQIVNFTIFASVLFYLLKGPVVAYFKGRGEQFAAAVKKAEESRLTAERTNAEIKERLARLEESTKSSVEEAKREAALLREKMIAEGKEAAQKLATEAERSAQFEFQRALAALRVELIEKSVLVAEDEVRTKSDDTVHAKLEKEFLKKVEAVRI